MALTNYRRPTVAEAVSAMNSAKTREYREGCITYWRDEFGQEFADQVNRSFSEKQKKGKEIDYGSDKKES